MTRVTCHEIWWPIREMRGECGDRKCGTGEKRQTERSTIFPNFLTMLSPPYGNHPALSATCGRPPPIPIMVLDGTQPLQDNQYQISIAH
jgi:hypothetical protein